MYKTKEELLMTINKCLPYSNQITELDFTSETDAIRFNWRGTNFKISLSGEVYEFGDGTLNGSNISILLTALVKRQWISQIDNNF